MEEISRTPRKLDVAESASIDIVGLNNKIVRMRTVVKKAKYQTVQKMIRTIEGLRKKKGSEEQLEKNKRKVDRFLEEIKAIKTLRANKVSKFALANTSTLNEICKRPDTCAQTRALVRLAEHQSLKGEVKKFREEHDDWKSLVEYLLGHVARRFYKNKYKVSKFKMETNVTVGNQLVKSYLEHKIGTDSNLVEKDKVDHGTKNKFEKSSQKSSEGKDKSTSRVPVEESTQKLSDSENNDKDSPLEDKLKHFDDSDDNDLEESDLKDEISEESDSKDEISEESDLKDEISGERDSKDEISEESDSKDEISEESDSKDEISEENDSKDEISDSEDEKLKQEEETDLNSTDNDSKDENKTKIYGEMVVKKLNMDELKNNADVDIPAFLISDNNEDNDKHVKKSKDSFFMCEDDENSDDSNSHPALYPGDRESDSSNSDNERQGLSNNTTRSLFIGALNATKKHWSDSDENSRLGRGRGGFRYSGEGRGSSHFNKYGGKWDNDRSHHFERRGRGSFPGKFSNTHQKAPREFQKSVQKSGSFQSSNYRKSQSGVRSNMYNKSEQKDSTKTAEKIHPSWEASKKRKEHSTIQAFQGKKIKFDDDD